MRRPLHGEQVLFARLPWPLHGGRQPVELREHGIGILAGRPALAEPPVLDQEATVLQIPLHLIVRIETPAPRLLDQLVQLLQARLARLGQEPGQYRGQCHVHTAMCADLGHPGGKLLQASDHLVDRHRRQQRRHVFGIGPESYLAPGKLVCIGSHTLGLLKRAVSATMAAHCAPVGPASTGLARLNIIT